MLGGLFGAFLVATQGLTVGTIGVALFSVAITAGQASSGLIVDHFGIGPSGHQPFSYPARRRGRVRHRRRRAGGR